MAKNTVKKDKKTVDQAVAASHKKANIIVSVVVGIAALLLIAVAVLSIVRVDPLDKVNAPSESKGEYYEIYDLGASAPLVAERSAQSKVRAALGEMKFSVLTAVLQWSWDYSYNFVRNSDGDKITMTADDVVAKKGGASEYMVEIIYTDATVNGELDKSKAQSLEVDGETVYFDRIKIVIGDTDGSVGEIYLYPYVYERATNKIAGEGVPYETYRVNPIKVRADTTTAYDSLASLIRTIKNS